MSLNKIENEEYHNNKNLSISIILVYPQPKLQAMLEDLQISDLKEAEVLRLDIIVDNNLDIIE